MAAGAVLKPKKDETASRGDADEFAGADVCNRTAANGFLSRTRAGKEKCDLFRGKIKYEL